MSSILLHENNQRLVYDDATLTWVAPQTQYPLINPHSQLPAIPSPRHKHEIVGTLTIRVYDTRSRKVELFPLALRQGVIHTPKRCYVGASLTLDAVNKMGMWLKSCGINHEWSHRYVTNIIQALNHGDVLCGEIEAIYRKKKPNPSGKLYFDRAAYESRPTILTWGVNVDLPRQRACAPLLRLAVNNNETIDNAHTL